MARGERTQEVRKVAAHFGVTERTVWRWLKAEPDPDGEYAVLDLLDMDPHCGWCGAELPLPPEATLGLRYCCDACRQAGHRRRAERRRRAAARAD